MAKTKLTATLSKDSFDKLAKQVRLFGEKYVNGVNLGIENATIECYELICKKLAENNLSNHIGNVAMRYDRETKTGKISTTDIVIIFHEFGTGIKGTQDEWASLFDYTVNASGKGEKGWYFKNETNGYEGITHGLTTKHIFYESLLEIQKKIPKTVALSVNRTVGAMY